MAGMNVFAPICRTRTPSHFFNTGKVPFSLPGYSRPAAVFWWSSSYLVVMYNCCKEVVTMTRTKLVTTRSHDLNGKIPLPYFFASKPVSLIDVVQ